MQAVVEMDVDGDGEIDVGEFRAWWVRDGRRCSGTAFSPRVDMRTRRWDKAGKSSVGRKLSEIINAQKQVRRSWRGAHALAGGAHWGARRT